MCIRDSFHTAPNTPQDVHELSYTFLDLYDWLDMINTTINPYTSPVTEGKLDLVYLHNGAACCTTVLNGSYYYQLDKRETAPAPKPAAAVEPQAEPQQPEPEPEVPAGPQVTTAPTPEPKPTPGDDDWLVFD